MLNQLPAQIIGFQVVLRTERMDDPHLVAGATGCDVKALLEEFLIAQRKHAALGGIDQGDKHHIALVTLELRGVAAKDAMKFIAARGNMRADEIVDFDSLLIADQRYHADAQRLARVVLRVLGLLHRGGDKGSYS